MRFASSALATRSTAKVPSTVLLLLIDFDNPRRAEIHGLPDLILPWNRGWH